MPYWLIDSLLTEGVGVSCLQVEGGAVWQVHSDSGSCQKETTWIWGVADAEFPAHLTSRFEKKRLFVGFYSPLLKLIETERKWKRFMIKLIKLINFNNSGQSRFQIQNSLEKVQRRLEEVKTVPSVVCCSWRDKQPEEGEQETEGWDQNSASGTLVSPSRCFCLSLLTRGRTSSTIILTFLSKVLEEEVESSVKDSHSC